MTNGREGVELTLNVFHAFVSFYLNRLVSSMGRYCFRSLVSKLSFY